MILAVPVNLYSVVIFHTAGHNIPAIQCLCIAVDHGTIGCFLCRHDAFAAGVPASLQVGYTVDVSLSGAFKDRSLTDYHPSVSTNSSRWKSVFVPVLGFVIITFSRFIIPADSFLSDCRFILSFIDAASQGGGVDNVSLHDRTMASGNFPLAVRELQIHENEFVRNIAGE